MAPPTTTNDENAAIIAAEDSQADKLNLTPGQARVVLERTAGTLAAAHGITVEFREGATPQTDGRTIVIPPPNVTSWEEWLQVRGYIDHETSHILWSDMNEFAKLNDFERLCLNALEDVRVNELMRSRYPGARENLSGMYRRTLAEAVANKPKRTQPIPEHMGKLGSLQIQLENLQALGAPEDLFGDAGCVAFAKQHAARFRADVDNAQTTADLSQAAVDLAKLIDPERAAQPRPQPQAGQGDGEGDEGESEGNGGAGEGQGEGNANGNSEADQGSQDQGESDKPGCSPLDQAAREAMGRVGGGAGTHRDRNERKNPRMTEKEYSHCEGRSHVSVIPKFQSFTEYIRTNGGKHGHYRNAYHDTAGQATELTNAMRLGAGVRDNLRQALRARTMARKTRDQENGGLDMGKLAVIAARVRDPAVYCKVSPGIAINTACHVLVDASGSMHDTAKWPTAPAAAAVFADAAIGCGAVARVTTFDDPHVGYEWCAFGEKPTRAEWVNRLKHAMPTGGTPTGNHIQAAARDILKRPEARKILVVCTDGQPDSAPYTSDMTRTARAAGVEVYTIALGMSQDHATRILGAGAVGCPSMADLRGVLLRILSRCLLREDGKGNRK